MTSSALALILVVLGQTAEEKAALERSAKVEEAQLQQDPNNAEALLRLGLAYLGLGQPQKAVKPLRELLKVDPESPDGRLLLARALRFSGEAQQAKAFLDEVLKTAPDDGALHAERGLLA